MGGRAKRGNEHDLILRSGVFAASRRMCHTRAAWFETAHRTAQALPGARLLTTIRVAHSAWQNMQGGATVLSLVLSRGGDNAGPNNIKSKGARIDVRRAIHSRQEPDRKHRGL